MLRTLAGSLLLLPSATALAQSLPSKPITLIVPNPPGGVVDTAARVVAQPLGQLLKHTVVVDNRPGGSGNIACQTVARSAPDGATLLVSCSAYHTANPSLMTKLPWAPKDFTPVALLVTATNVVAVHPSLPVNTLGELVAYLKKNPGKFSYASQGTVRCRISAPSCSSSRRARICCTFRTRVPARRSRTCCRDACTCSSRRRRR